MFRYFITILAAILISVSAWADGINKQTHLYAVKGADSLYLDHYIAPVEGKRPCMMFVFGGGFVGGQRDNKLYAQYFEFLTKQGFDVVSIDYRLGLRNIGKQATDGSIRSMIGIINNAINIAVEDLFSATLFVIDKAEEWQIDTANIVTSGSSAGAITVLQAEHNICNRTARAAVLPAGFNYAGVISFAGAIFSTDGNPKWNSQPAPIMLFHGSADRQVPYDKVTMLRVGFFGSKFLSDEFTKQGWPHWFYSINYDSHNVAGTPMFDNHNEIATFLNDFALARRPLTIKTDETDGEKPKCKTNFKIMDYIEANYGK